MGLELTSESGTMRLGSMPWSFGTHDGRANHRVQQLVSPVRTPRTFSSTAPAGDVPPKCHTNNCAFGKQVLSTER